MMLGTCLLYTSKVLPMDIAKGLLGRHYRLGWKGKQNAGKSLIEEQHPDGLRPAMDARRPEGSHAVSYTHLRLVQPHVVEQVVQKLQPNGFIHMATDWENYAEQMLEVLSANENLINTAEQDYIPRPDFRPLTKFEARGHRLGHGVWDLYFKKK